MPRPAIPERYQRRSVGDNDRAKQNEVEPPPNSDAGGNDEKDNEEQRNRDPCENADRQSCWTLPRIDGWLC